MVFRESFQNIRRVIYNVLLWCYFEIRKTHNIGVRYHKHLSITMDVSRSFFGVRVVCFRLVSLLMAQILFFPYRVFLLDFVDMASFLIVSVSASNDQYCLFTCLVFPMFFSHNFSFNLINRVQMVRLEGANLVRIYIP